MLTNENNHNDKNQFEKEQEDFDKWCNKWSQAQDEGIFDEAPGPHVPTQDLGDHSFFGPTNSHSNDDVKDVDVTYWNQVHALSTGQDMGLISEAGVKRPATEIVGEPPKLKPAPGWSNKQSTASQKVSQGVGTSANPIFVNTVGKDQDLKSAQMDATFSERDIEDLAEMKLKLHDLENQVNTFDSNSKSSGKYATKIESLKTQIDDLSDRMTRTHPDQSAP
ncbi:MAG: hypothetical protein ACW99G_03010 [Candidatus Thorarchaeota archaeon]|jgi:hypothetical protein